MKEKAAAKNKKRPQKDSNLLRAALGWLFVLAALGLIYYMVNESDPVKSLVCSEGRGVVSLTRFGTCHTE